MLLKKILLPAFILLTFSAIAQTSYLIPGGKEEWLLNRLDIRFSPSYLRFSSIKPYNRRDAAKDVQEKDSLQAVQGANLPRYFRLTKVDNYNIESFLMANAEWSTLKPSFVSKTPILKHFYKTKANAYEQKNKDYYIVFNPIIQYQQYKEKNNTENLFLNSRGLQARGVIENKIGFSFYFTENQERPPSYVSNWVNLYKAVPGVGYYKRFKTSTGFDYFDIRSSLSWKVAKWMDMQLAYDKNFIGNGYRSLFLSDFSNNYMFLKVNTHFKKFQYQNIFAELFPFQIPTSDKVLSRKYFRANYLNYAATKWLNLGLFEGTMMGKDRLTVGLFNPVIYLQIPGNNNGIKDRNYLGFDVKANVLHTVQLYGQLMIDKLKVNDVGDKTWDNRFGYQLGFKYIDAFGLRNLDLQFESNRVRAYTYAANDTLTNYSHYNQPLAHPLGANFQEFIGIIKYQPISKLYLTGKVITYNQGKNIGTYNLGSNIFGGFNNRLSDVRVRVGDGDGATCLSTDLLASYELKQNLFIDASFTTRRYETLLTPKTSTSFVSLGVRWNMARREYDFY
jgi:hypothetical protein